VINQVVEEEEGDTEGEEAQEYLFFNTESRQDDDRHISTLLIVQDDMRFEMIFKGDDLHSSIQYVIVAWNPPRCHLHSP